jgi:NDP-sugar pyrophosphorylase family protein
MIAVLLAAGRGTRMGTLTEHTPKPLLRLQGQPILEHILRGLQTAGIGHVVIVTGYRGTQIEARFGDGHDLGLEITYRRQETVEGTARALELVRPDIGNRPFVVSWGDVVVEPDLYRGLLAAFRRNPCDALLTVNACDDPWRGAAVYVDAQWRVTRLVEKPPRGTSSTQWNNSGVFVFSPLIFEYTKRLAPSPRGEYELPQAIGGMIAAGCVIRAYPVSGFWSDLGTPEDLEEAERVYPSAGGAHGRPA